MSEADDIVQEFLAESYDDLDRLEQDVVALERDPVRSELLGSVFRTLHTLKASSGVLGYRRLGQLAHAGEGVLGGLRDGAIPLTRTTTSALLRLVDAARELLDAIETTGSDDVEIDADVVAGLTAMIPSPAEPVDGVRLAPPDVSVVIPSPPGAPVDGDALPLGQVLVDRGAAGPDAVTLAVMQQGEGDRRPLGEILVGHGATTVSAVVEALQQQAEIKRASSDSGVRVDAALLDTLLRLTGELSLCGDRVVAALLAVDDPAAGVLAAELRSLSEALGDGVRRTRQQPIESVWGRLDRVVRDLGEASGKPLRLAMDGGDLCVDRTVLEAVKDPLTHCVRNAVDHGIERPEHRLAADKPVVGTVRLRAVQLDGQLVLEVSDDGRGIDPDAVGATAVAQGRLTSQQLSRLPARAVLQLVLAPGFTTAAGVTELSGRGVGLDVVRTNLERIGGRVEIASTVGRGTTVRLVVPVDSRAHP